MSHGSALSRGDVRRNARQRAMREVVRRDRAIVAIDLADEKQVVAVCDHDNVVLARRTVQSRAWQLAETLVWARGAAAKGGFAGVVVGCEPTGHRWLTVLQQCDTLGLDLVCVQPLLVHRERERDDLTKDRSDARDARLIAGLVAELRCYLPERAAAPYARLRHLGMRRVELTARHGAALQQARSLLECAWPASLTAAAEPLESATWLAALAVVLHRSPADPAQLHRLRRARFEAAVRTEVRRHGGSRVCRRIARAVWDAAVDTGGVTVHRHGALERTGFALADLEHTAALLVDVEQRMVALLDELGLTALATSIDGLSAVGAAAIIAETGDLTRFPSARSVVKHAGICARDNESGRFAGTTAISRRGRPLLRLAAWRALWGALPHNPVLMARYQHLRTRTHNPLTAQQARVAVCGSLLRQLHAVIVSRTPYDPTIAAGRTAEEVMPSAA